MAANPQIRSVEVEKGGVLVTLYVPMRNPTSPLLDALGLADSVITGGGSPSNGTRQTRTRSGGGRRGQTKASMVLEAVKGGATTPKEIASTTGLENKQVHAYLSYHSKKGNLKRNDGEWALTDAGEEKAAS